MGITNFVSRPFAGLATIVTEYTDSPLNFVLAFAVSSIFVVKNVKEIDEQKLDTVFLKTEGVDYDKKIKLISSCSKLVEKEDSSDDKY